MEVFAHRGGRSVPLALTTSIPKFGGAEDKVFALSPGLDAAPFYVRVARLGSATTDLAFSTSP